MENQGRRLLLAVGLALGVMLVWNFAFPPDEPKKKDDAAKPAATSTVTDTATPKATPTSTVGGPAAVKPAAPSAPEEKIALAFPGKLTATFSSYGGALVSWKLDDSKFERDVSRGEMLPGAPKSEDPLARGAFWTNFDRSSDVFVPPDAVWKGEKLSDTSVRYTLSTPQLDVEKTYELEPAAYLVRARIKYTVKDKAARQALAMTTYGYQSPTASFEDSTQSEARVWSSATYRAGDHLQTIYPDLVGTVRSEANVQWTGFEHPYMLVAYAPRPGMAADSVRKRTFVDGTAGLMRTDVLFPSETIKAGESASHEIVGYLGPKNYHTMHRADEAAGFATGFSDTMDLGWFAFIGRPLLWLLQKFYDAFKNWGIAIILLTILVKAATLYWTTKSMRSMKAMAALAPQMKALQEKYKDDRQRLQVETMAMYKEHNVNPIAGCLPILLQMPVWIALYRMLSTAGELYQAPFIPGWIDDLTSTDPFYVLPVLLVVTMFAQARLTPSAGTSGQQKMLQYGMPLMFGVMAFFFPAGLTLYIFTNTILSALHSIYMNKFDKKSIALTEKMKAAAAAAEAAKKAEADKAAAKAAGKTAKPVKTAAKAAKPVEVEDRDGDGDGDEEGGDDDGEAADEKPVRRPQGAQRNRPRRKKRRR